MSRIHSFRKLIANQTPAVEVRQEVAPVKKTEVKKKVEVAKHVEEVSEAKIEVKAEEE